MCRLAGAATRRSQAAAVLRLTTSPSYRPPIGRQQQPSPPGPTIAHCLTLHILSAEVNIANRLDLNIAYRRVKIPRK